MDDEGMAGLVNSANDEAPWVKMGKPAPAGISFPNLSGFAGVSRST
ncbi:hypothetical protein ACG04R_27025 [Roseateles sp. BYS78W]|uniref:Uncharacterized protein n=1 Tax=Pelomonas candidula TaxID=3299025 RepID=A0ABW7HL12_9BURK